MINSRFSTLLVLLGGALLCATPADAQTSQACAAAKLGALGKTAASVFNCYAKAAKIGAAVDPACIQKAEDKWNFPAKGSFQKAELKGGCALEGQNFVLEGRCTGNPAQACNVSLDCPGTGPCANRSDATEVQGLYDLVVDENLTVEEPSPGGAIDIIVPALLPNPAVANKCQSDKLKNTGKLASGVLGCHSKAAKSNVTVDQACIAKATDKHTQAFAKSEASGPCDTTADAGAVQASLTTFVELALAGIPRNDGCGSGVTLAPETCDDGNAVNTDNCPGDCVVDACTPNSGSDDAWTVSFSSSKNVAAITLFLDYPEGKVGLVGSGAVPPTEIDGILGEPDTVTSFNDRDHGLTAVLAEGAGGNFGPSGDLFTVHFETCSAAPPAVAGDFSCTVLEAADALGKPLKGVTCTVN
jgi:hypothetical protein